MGMRLCLELIATSIQQLQDLEHIAASPVSSSIEIETRNLNLEDAANVLRASLTELEVYQQSLIGELDRYRELFDFAPDGYFVTDANGDITESNRAATLMFGSLPIGQNLENFVYPSYKEQFQRLLGQLQRGQNIKSLDFRMQFPTGQPFDASFTIISIRVPLDGRVTGLRWWIQDITQRKQEVDKLQHSHQRLEIRVAEMNAKLNLMDRQIRVEREEQRRISRNLAHNEAKLRAVMQHSSDIVNILDIDTTINYCSPAIFRTLGYMPEDVMGSKFISFIHPEDLPIFQDFLTQSADALSLQDSELRLAAIASSMPATLYRLSINSDGKIAIPFISDGLIDLVGISPRYVISSPYQLLDLVHPEDVDQFKALIRDGFDKLATFHHEFRVITVSGEVKWVQNITRYYRTESDMIFADGVCIDISERGEAESSLQRTNELLRAVIKAVPVAIDIVSPEGKVLLWNAAAEKLFAWNTSTVVGHPVPSVPESQALELQAVILDTLAGRQINGVPMTFQLGDGSWTNVNVSTVLVHDPHGKIVGILRIIDEAGDRSSIETKHNQTLQLEEVQSASMVRSSTEAIANFVTLNANTLLNQYKIGQRNFAGLNLRGVYLVEADLRYADFSGVALNGSNCSYANFQSVNLRGADLRGANFQFANLQQVDLRGADLRGADLRDANTIGSILDDSNLQGALLSVD